MPTTDRGAPPRIPLPDSADVPALLRERYGAAPAARPIPAPLVLEFIQVLAQALCEDRVDARAKASRTYQRSPYEARERALAHCAEQLAAMLAGLVAPDHDFGGVTADAIHWAIGWVRADLARDPVEAADEGGGSHGRLQ